MVALKISVLLLYLALSFVETITSLEPTNSTGRQPSAVMCNVCWSLESAIKCQTSSKSEPCSPEQLDATMSRMRLIHPSAAAEQNLSAPVGERHLQQFRCFTLSASTGKGESKSHFYAKGCTTESSDPCSGWAKEKGGASCSLCTGNNCNSPLPTEIGHNAPAEAKKKACSSSSSGEIGMLRASFIRMLVVAVFASRCTQILM